MDRRRRLVVGVVALLAGAVAAVAGLLAMADDDAPADPPPTTDEPPARADDPDGPTDVDAHGADGSDDADDTEAILAALEAARDGRVEFGPGTYLIDGSLVLPPWVAEVQLADDTVIRQTADAPIFVRRGGVVGDPRPVTGARAGSATLELTAGDPPEPGTWVVVSTERVVERSKAFRLGSLRQVTDVDGGRATLDRPLVRDLAEASELWEMTLAPTVTITGGALEQADPLGSFSPLVLFEWVDRPRLEQVELRDCGGSGVKVVGTRGGRLDVFVHDCVDDHAGARFDRGRHYGYGVEVAGPTRELTVTGRATAVRHAFTTNGSFPIADDRLVNVGEPEDIDVSMEVWDTTSTGLDTHEIGHRIRFHDCTVTDAGRYAREGSTDGKEGGFGIFIRAPDTIVENCDITGSAVSGVVVASPSPGFDAWARDHAPVVVDTRIVDTRGRSAVQLKQPAVLRSVEIRGAHRFGIRFERAGEDSEVVDSSITLVGDETTFAFVNPGRAQLANNAIGTDEREFG